MGIAIGVIIVLALAILFAVLTIKSKNSDLFKWVGIIIFVAFFLTWVIPYGYYQGSEFVANGLNRLGLSDIPTVMYYGVYFCLTTVLYLFVLGGFYGVLSKSKGYGNLVKKIAKAIKGKEVMTAIIIMAINIVLTSLLKSQLVLLVFVPFTLSILINAKFDKLTAMGATFGSILVGILAATYGTEGLYWFNYYGGFDKNTGLTHRLIIGGIALVLYVGYNVFRIIKSNNQKKTAKEEVEDLFEVEEGKKAAIWPSIVLFVFLFIFVFLGYFNWENVGVTAFTKFHNWLMGLTIGKDFTLVKNVLGSSAAAFGAMEINVLIVVLLVLTPIVALCSRIKCSDASNAFGEGFKKMFKPTCLFVLSYVVFIVVYMTPFTATITNWAFGLTKTLNPYLAMLTSFITSLFQTDLGYTSYLVGGMIANTYPDNISLMHTIYVTGYGLAQVLLPTSGILLIGLSYLKIDYKSWLKYIWIFAAAMLVVILIVITVLRYAM